jgi:hypothetical protein
MEWFLATTPEGDLDTTFGWLKACEAERASSIPQKKQIKMPWSFILLLNELNSR